MGFRPYMPVILDFKGGQKNDIFSLELLLTGYGTTSGLRALQKPPISTYLVKIFKIQLF